MYWSSTTRCFFTFFLTIVVIFGHIFLFSTLGFVFINCWKNMFWKKGKFLVNILGCTGDIREIKSASVRVDRSLSINVISHNMATVLGCHITPVEPSLALVEREPVRLIGHTSIMICRPKARRWKGKFTSIDCKIAQQTMHHIVLYRSTQKALKLYQQHTPYYSP